MSRFFLVVLRTSDVGAARDFYASVLGSGEELEIVQLHEQAVARGARPHWLGFIDVGDIDRALESFGPRGATVMARWTRPDGLEAAVVRDPGGAIVALAKPPAGAGPSRPKVGSYLLNTVDLDRARADYGELCGWSFLPPVEVAPKALVHPFSWNPDGSPSGAMIDVRARPEIHPHWLFQLEVQALDPALEAVLDGGGKIVERVELPTGERIAVCEDPQGAAFALGAAPVR